MDDPDRLDRQPDPLPKGVGGVTLSILACIVAALAITAFGYTLAQVLAPYFVH